MPAEHTEMYEKNRILKELIDREGLDFYNSVKKIIAQRLKHRQVIGEDIRIECNGVGIFPSHNNVWGATINKLIKDNILIPTKRYKPMTLRGSHARASRIYIVR